MSSCSATRRSVDLAFVAFESILHVLSWSDRCLLCLASRNRRAPALANHWLLLVYFSINLLVVYRESVNLIVYITRRLSADSQQL